MQVNSEATTGPATQEAPTEATQHVGSGTKAAAAVVSQRLSAGDAEKAAALRKMKLLALSLLIAMAVIFVFAFALQKDYPWLQYVRAAAEGGMVGALADWFAVSALFRHPFGLKIPHTAIIPTRKNEIGESLGEFVEENFLSETVVREKLASVGVSRVVGAWLATPANAKGLTTELATAAQGALTLLRG